MTTDEEEKKTGIYKFLDFKNWFFSQFCKTFLITCVLNIIIWGGFIAALPFFGPELEHFLFPSVKHIQRIRTEIDRIHLLQEEKNKDYEQNTSKIQQDLTELRNDVKKLSEQLKRTHEQPSLGIPTNSTSNELEKHWNCLLMNFAKGESFEKELHALDPYVKEHKDVLVAIHELVNIASKETRPFNKLAVDLIAIKVQIENKQTNDKKGKPISKHSWINDLWEKLKSHISFERTNQPPVILKDQSQKEFLIKTIDHALTHIQKHNYKDAIDTITPHKIIAQPAFDQWLIDAEERLSVELKIETLRQHINPFLTAKVN
ncbi:MAG: hypothetical protein Q8S21_00540 [Candidatus Paracaedibacteraceae bacterium]|nr:hypothetical protein [Candidatus Paracaedibacteraceae bacterium]